MSIRSFRVASAILVLGAGGAQGQSPFPLALQFGFGAEIPLGAFADVAGNGAGISIGTGVQLVPNVALYAGYSRIRFDSHTFGGDLIDSGMSVGVSVVVPGVSPRVFPWFGAGGVFHGLEISGAATQPDRWNPGIGLGAGVLVPVHPNIRVSPSLGYVGYSTAIPGAADLTVSYLSVGISLNLGF